MSTFFNRGVLGRLVNLSILKAICQTFKCMLRLILTSRQMLFSIQNSKKILDPKFQKKKSTNQ